MRSYTRIRKATIHNVETWIYSYYLISLPVHIVRSFMRGALRYGVKAYERKACYVPYLLMNIKAPDRMDMSEMERSLSGCISKPGTT